MFCPSFRSRTTSCVQLVYLPFDLWINARNRNAQKYAERFFLADLTETVRCIKNGRRFLAQRYDTVKKVGILQDAPRVSTQELFWNGRLFFQYGEQVKILSLLKTTDLYLDPQTGYPYSLFPATVGRWFLFDGTLVIPREVYDLYDLRVFIEATWPIRVARMVRRYNHKKVFGATQKTLPDYVGFLVAESRQCADAGISMQCERDVQIMMVESGPDSISNYLDLVHLLNLAKQGNVMRGLTDQKEIEAAIMQCLEYFRKLHDARTILKFREELIALMESKHFLSFPDVGRHLSELASIFLLLKY